MTFIQPHQNKNFINVLICILIFALFIGSFWLVWLYNKSVDFEHSSSNLKSQIKNLETQSAAIQEKIFSLFNPDNVQNIAQEKNLIVDKNPEYLKVENKAEAVALKP